jgi:hypothetical protein
MRSKSRKLCDDSEILADLLRRTATGVRTCVPVFGTGLNLQAATVEGYKDRDDWWQLLVKIGKRINISEKELQAHSSSNLALWETLLCIWAERMGVYPYKAEGQLQTFVCEELKRQEKECQNFRLYRDLATAGFEDIISLNFDRRIAMSCQSHKFVAAPSPCPYGGHGESMFRHSTVQPSPATTARIWYPHGDVKKATTIKLGVRKYGFYIGIFREHLRQLGDSWRYKPNSVQARTATEKSLSRCDAPTWFDLILHRPLVFVGCGLLADEWPLWWLLRMRGLRYRSVAPTYYITIRKPGDVSPPHFNLLSGMRVVSFESPQELWDTFLGWISHD